MTKKKYSGSTNLVMKTHQLTNTRKDGGDGPSGCCYKYISTLWGILGPASRCTLRVPNAMRSVDMRLGIQTIPMNTRRSRTWRVVRESCDHVHTRLTPTSCKIWLKLRIVKPKRILMIVVYISTSSLRMTIGVWQLSMDESGTRAEKRILQQSVEYSWQNLSQGVLFRIHQRVCMSRNLSRSSFVASGGSCGTRLFGIYVTRVFCARQVKNLPAVFNNPTTNPLLAVQMARRVCVIPSGSSLHDLKKCHCHS